MDERILVEVYVPAASITLMLYLPLYQKVVDIQLVLYPKIEEISNEQFHTATETMLYMERIHAPLPPSLYLHETGIRHGERIILL